MCGIAGIVSQKPQTDDGRVVSMLQAIRHRGPDDSGTWMNPERKIVLGHCRLSILDLTYQGHQPMISDDGNLSLVFNGEIYNFRDLKKQFFAGDDSFRSSGDTELLLRMWQLFGKNCLQYLRGMFAFTVWDRRSEKLFLARDPCGIKPLYYKDVQYGDRGEFVFASELKAFSVINKYWPIDYEAMGLFLRWGSIPAPKTIYQGVQSLPAGSLLTLDLDGQTAIESYWNYQDIILENNNNDHMIRSRGEAVEWVREKTLESVRSHLVSDEPVGAFLSGGIDSSAIVSLMRQSGQSDIGTFSIGFDDEAFDESGYAQTVADKFETHHVCRVLTKARFLASIDRFFIALDQPTLDGLNTFVVSELAHDEGYKVVTSGIGGDEVFAGYNRDFRAMPKLWKQLNYCGKTIQTIMRKALDISVAVNAAPAHWARVGHYLSGPSTLARCLDMGRGIYSTSEIRKIFTDSAIGEEAASIDADSYLPELAPGLNVRDAVSYFLLSRYLGSQLLRDSDNFSMAFSLELRTPLVDAKLYADLAVIRNQNWFLQGDIGKALFIDAVGDLPRSITHRKKKGFTPPFKIWLQSTEFSLESGLIATDYYDETLNAYKEGRIPWSRVWMLIVADRFLSRLN
ncbi:asparagine synthase (glutamine-hydrolyzing) [Rubellicoccus peritrichatus]|uniref:asparagine synthase (glutamine-hydrolyzing) n=1 Tax=Rubellicoccus peritrichatus TaxID=3080537 RepID=A0AAQ3LB89_9BACT|nr:asparagine synthase (glutamine-hydrolyzing) [Puniceicoccus sp. CR14]WOO42914.1 asparagine synthase (glutamine-hydrolyzing) [Puniceicoccus sp. CR14]